LPDDLLAKTLYHFRVRSRDSDSNESVSQDYTFNTLESQTTLDAADTTGPIITNIEASLTAYSGATIAWDTDEPATTQLAYGTSAGSYTASSTLDTTLTRNHSVTLTGLSQDTTYYYRVFSADSAGNETLDDNSGNSHSFTTSAPLGGGVMIISDNNPPTLTSIEVSDITKDSAKITWNTGELSSSLVAYGLTTAYGELTGDHAAKTMEHTVVLQKLEPATTYHYKAFSYDESSNQGSSVDKTFTTLSEEGEAVAPTPEIEEEEEALTLEEGGVPTPEAVKEEEITPIPIISKMVKTIKDLAERFQAKKIEIVKKEIPTQKNRAVLANVKKDTANVMGNIKNLDRPNVLSAAVIGAIDGIVDGVSRAGVPNDHFEQIWSETANIVVSAPMIAGKEIRVEPGSINAKISWLTDKKSNSLVAIASAEEYDIAKEEPYALVIGNAEEQVTAHFVEIPNLEPSTLYHFQVRSRGLLGEFGKSEDQTFTTFSLLPEITDVKFEKITENEVAVSWVTNVPTASQITVVNTKTGEAIMEKDSSFIRDHRFSLQNLLPSTSYHFQITAVDESNNESKTSVLPFSTVIDVTPPRISNIRTYTALIPGKTERVQVIIRWLTHKPATAKILYEEGFSRQPQFSQSTPLNPNLNIEHTMVLTSLRPSKVHCFVIEATDAFGNKSQSPMFTILTPRSKDTIMNLMIKHFEETFGFLKKLRF
jgi:hypothetical protein